ncbi:MAG: hypothetical protein ACI92I_000035 [Acidimicrobiales bacterium]|jgi:hypothetical protein
MLDQRRAEEKGYITLKEAAKIANYTPDYVGQLIRGGKIKGEQVYNNVAWVTTEDEVAAYMKDKGRTVDNDTPADFAVLQQMSSYVLYGLIALCAVALLFMQYVLYVSIDAGISSLYMSESADVQLAEEVITMSSI